MLANARFNDVVTSEEQFRAVMENPMPPVIKKEISYLDANCRAFIAKCPFVLISSCDGEGRMDISPKGDPAGFVHVLDDQSLAISDRPGNRRADTFQKHPAERPSRTLLRHSRKARNPASQRPCNDPSGSQPARTDGRRR